MHPVKIVILGRDGAVKRWRAVGVAQPLPGNAPPTLTPAPWRPGLGMPFTPSLPGRG